MSSPGLFLALLVLGGAGMMLLAMGWAAWRERVPRAVAVSAMLFSLCLGSAVVLALARHTPAGGLAAWSVVAGAALLALLGDDLFYGRRLRLRSSNPDLDTLAGLWKIPLP